MKQIVLFILCIAGCSFVWGQDVNYYRNPDRIYLDSKDGHQGAFLWKMKKAGDVTAGAEAVSKPDMRQVTGCRRLFRVLYLILLYITKYIPNLIMD